MAATSNSLLTFEPLRQGDSLKLDQALALYARAIPPHERKPEAQIRRLTSSDRHVIEAAVAKDVLVGFSVTYVGPEAGLLEYLAVEEGWRSQGVGGELFRRAVAAMDGAPLLIEVESDRRPAADLEQRRRRLGFYRALGCRRVEGLDYILPLPTAAEPLDLLVAGVDGGMIAREALRGWLQAIYVDVYGCDAADSRIGRMLAGGGELRLA